MEITHNRIGNLCFEFLHTDLEKEVVTVQVTYTVNKHPNDNKVVHVQNFQWSIPVAHQTTLEKQNLHHLEHKSSCSSRQVFSR